MCIFGLFFLIAGKDFHERLLEHTAAKAMILKEIVEDKIKNEPGRLPAQNIGLKTFISHLSQSFHAKVWIVDAKGRAVVKSFHEPVPAEGFENQFNRVRDLGDFKLYRNFKGPYNYFTRIPIALSNHELGSLNLLFFNRRPLRPEKGFAWGLFFIGLIIALLCIPVSRLIIKPIKRLQFSVLKIAEGDLSHRGEIKSRDEIGELGRAFNQMADQLERMIKAGRELTANVSHELRSPLARIRVAEEILRERCEQRGFQEGKPYLDEIQEEIIELDRLIERILFLSKLDVHENSSKQEKVDLKPIIEGIIERHDSTLQRKGIDLVLDLKGEAWLFGDRESLITAISNVVDNAVKFTAPGGTIGVKTLMDHNELKVCFTNSFPRIDDEEMLKIFEPFHQTGTRPEVGGSGLGLAIVQKIIVSQGGEVQARSTDDGFSICFRFPVRADF
jgi:two-component system sensor histidine kinase CpxA